MSTLETCHKVAGRDPKGNTQMFIARGFDNHADAMQYVREGTKGIKIICAVEVQRPPLANVQVA